MEPLTNSIHSILELTWPMVFISCVIAISWRVFYLIMNKSKIVFYHEIIKLFFMIYILCLYQIVTFQDVSNLGNSNFTFFKEILRYDFGSRLFIKNVLGNMLLFIPYGFFACYYVKIEKPLSALGLISIASLAIEITQLLIGRVFDVDDILLNIIGGMIGYFICRVLQRIFTRLPKIFKREWFLNILMAIILGLFIYLLWRIL